jgi:transcriptional regulator with XRE-family HTH domain
MSRKRSQEDDEAVAVELGRRIRRARRRAEMSQERLAALAGLHRTTIGLIEAGKRNMQTSTLLFIAGALEVELDEIIGGIEFIAGPEPLARSGTWRFDPPAGSR